MLTIPILPFHQHRYGYKEDTICSECGGDMALAFVPLILIGIVALIAVIAFLKGGSLINLETMVQGGAKAAVKEAMQAKHDQMLEKVNEKVAENQQAKAEGAQSKSGKHKAMSFTFMVVFYVQKVVGFIQRAGVKIKILVSLWQVLQGVGATFSIPFPPFYDQVVSAVGGLLQIELPSLMPLDCMVSTNFYSKLIFKCVWPLGAYVALALLSKVLRKCGKVGKADSCVNFAFFLMFVLYPSISNGLLSMFYCVPLEDGTTWLRVDLSIQCVEPSGAYKFEHAGMLAFTFVMLGLHIVGTPAIYTYLLFWKHKGVLDALKEQVGWPHGVVCAPSPHILGLPQPRSLHHPLPSPSPALTCVPLT